MAVKVSNQTTILDITDGFSVIMTNENYTFLGNTTSVASTQSTTTQIMVMQGTEQIPCKIGQMTCPTGISAVSDGKSPVPTVTITATTAVRQNGSFNIPIIADDVTLNKTFSYSIAFTGQKGDTGAKGEDSILLCIESSNGTTFKNSDVATIFTVSIYVGGVVIDNSSKLREMFGDSAYLQWLIKRHGETEFSKIPLDDSRLNDNGFMFTISAKDIKFKAVFNCELNV